MKEKYGEASVAQIGTFGTHGGQGGDQGRRPGAGHAARARQSHRPSMVPERAEHHARRGAEAKHRPASSEYDTDPQVRELIDIARKLEGTNRNVGTHAAGVVIADGPLTDYVPRAARHPQGRRRRASRRRPVITTQWAMGDLEKVGLLKMDFLGLRTLTVLDKAVKLIEKTRGDEDRPRTSFRSTTAKTFAAAARGEAKGVFQFEADGIRELLKRMKPDNIRDLIATNALYRPGPLDGGMVDDYVKRKHGREKPTYPHPDHGGNPGRDPRRDGLPGTGMRILNRLGGIELANAYACIKAISKKKHDIIDARRAEFIKGAEERGVSRSDGGGDLRPDRELRRLRLQQVAHAPPTP